MAFRYDKPYRTNTNIDPQKIFDLFNLVYQMDTQEIMQYSLINKLPLNVTIASSGNNLIHEILLNEDKLKNEFNKLNVIKFLVQNDVNPDEPNKENQTPIHIACQKQYKEIVEFLIKDCEVNLNYKDNNGYTPLHYLLIGEIKIYEKKEISDLISFQRKGNTVKKDEIIEIKKLLYPILKDEPFILSLEDTIYETLKNSPEIEQILFETQNIFSTQNKSNNKENKEFISIQRNEMKKVVDRLWGKFSNTNRLELHIPTKDSYIIKEKDNIGIIKNSNIKKEIKKELHNIVDNFKNYSEEIIGINKIVETTINKDTELISKIYNEFINKSNYITDKRNPYINFHTDFDFFVEGEDKIFNDINSKYKSNKAYDFADNIIDINDKTFYGGSRNMKLNYNYKGIEMFDDIRSWFDNEENDEIKFKKLFIHLILKENGIDNIDTINYLNSNDMINEFINHFYNINPNNINNYIKNYINKIFIPEYATEIYCKYTELCSKYNDDLLSYNLNANYNILTINFMSCLIHKQYTFENFIANLSFFYVSYLVKQHNNLNEASILKTIFLNFVTPLRPYIDEDADADEVNRLIDEIYANPNNLNFKNNTIEKIIEKVNIMVENNKIKVPNTMLTDFIYMIKDYYNFVLFTEYYFYNFDYDYFIEILDVIIKARKNNISNIRGITDDENQIFNLILSNICPSFKNFIYYLFDDNYFDLDYRAFLFDKLFEGINLKLNFRGVIPVLINDTEFIGNNYIVDVNNINKFVLLDYSSNLNKTVPLPGNYYFSLDDIDKNTTNNYYIYNFIQYRPPFIVSLCNLYIIQINTITRLLKVIFTNEEKSYYTLINSIKQGKIKDISKYYLEFYYIVNNLITLQKDIVNKYKENPEIKIKVKIFNITELNNFLNKINAYVFLYYYLFSPDNDPSIKIPKFSYYRVDYDKSFIFDSKYELLLPDNDPSIINDNLFNINKEKLEKIKPDYFISYLSNIFLDNAIVKNQQYFQNKKNILPPSMEVELKTFFEYNKILLFQTFKSDKYAVIINKIIDILNKQEIDIKNSQIFFYLFKLIEENIKDQAELFTDKAISKILNEKNIININDNKQLYSIGEFRNTKITFDKDIDEDSFKNFYLFRNQGITEECKFIIYPNEYNNTNVLKQMYCLKINQDILKYLIDNNADPYLIDDNGNSVISPLEKTYHHESITTIRKNNIDINNFGLPKNPLVQLNNENINHINKLLKGDNFNDFITNFTSSQYNEIKVILLSNNRFGNNIINYLDTSFKTIFYIINEYLTDTLWRFNENYKLKDMNDIFNLTGNDKNNIIKNYLFKYLKTINDIPSSSNIIIMTDYLKQLDEELAKINYNLNKHITEVIELRKAKLNIIDNKNKRKQISYDLLKKKKETTRLQIKINNAPRIKIISIEKDPKKIIDTYNQFVNKYDSGVYLECWEKLFTSTLTSTLYESWNLDLIKIVQKEKELIKNPNLNELKIINTFYEQICILSKIYFEESRFTEKNKVLKFVYDLLEHMTKTYICFNIEMTLRNLLTKYYMDLSINKHFIDINNKIDYLLEAENVLHNKKFKDILYNDLPKEFVRNSVDIFFNYEDKQSFEPKSVKEILNDLFNLLTVGDVINIPSNSPFMQVLNNELTDYFDLFIQKIINNWLVVVENIFKFTINQYRINKCILELQK
jgi:hypothetical protein